VVTEGAFDGSHAFVADSVLAKHDETYMPKEVADRLKKDGVWVDGKAKGAATAGGSADAAGGASSGAPSGAQGVARQ
jgi:cytochrome c-type biogenesis protein CcmE